MLTKFSLLTITAVALASAAQADVSISNKPTQNMSCVSGVCTATAQKAVLNAGELQALLSSGDVMVKTGAIAKDIAIDQSLNWTSTSRLTLEAQQSVIMKKQVTVAGQGSLTVTTNDAGNPKKNGGEFAIVPERGSIQFWDLGSSLIINGNSYTLVGDIKTLASDIATNPSGFYALVKPYDASGDGTYAGSAIPGKFPGTFEGLGNTISNFTMLPSAQGTIVFGFFEEPAIQGVVRDFGLVTVSVNGNGSPIVGTLAGGNGGTIERCWATGKFVNHNLDAGGLVGTNGGTIQHSFTNVEVTGNDISYAGGLVGYNAGLINQSYAEGTVRILHGFDTAVGGLVGYNEAQDGRIVDSYSVGKIRFGRNNCCDFGGLVGRNGEGAKITNAYAAGPMSKNGRAAGGGLVGDDEAAPGSIANGYWDLDRGIGDPSQGAGNIPNDPGITGLSDAQLKSGLPAGFDPKVWGRSPNINHGYPYLLANPPK